MATKKQRDLKQYNGVHFDKRNGIYTCQLKIDGIIHTNGSYFTSDAAALAYNEMLYKYKGNLNKLNIVEGVTEFKTASKLRRQLNKQIRYIENYLEIDIISKNSTYTLILDRENEYILEKYSLSIRLDKKSAKSIAYVVFYNNETKKKTYLHRFLRPCPNNLVVDHKNRNSLDNRLENLRIVEIYINCQNKNPRKSRSGFEGITKVSRKKSEDRYQAGFINKGKYYSVGTFSTLEEAIFHYNKALLEIRNGEGNLHEQKK